MILMLINKDEGMIGRSILFKCLKQFTWSMLSLIMSPKMCEKNSLVKRFFCLSRYDGGSFDLS